MQKIRFSKFRIKKLLPVIRLKGKKVVPIVVAASFIITSGLYIVRSYLRHTSPTLVSKFSLEPIPTPVLSSKFSLEPIIRTVLTGKQQDQEPTPSPTSSTHEKANTTSQTPSPPPTPITQPGKNSPVNEQVYYPLKASCLTGTFCAKPEASLQPNEQASALVAYKEPGCKDGNKHCTTVAGYWVSSCIDYDFGSSFSTTLILEYSQTAKALFGDECDKKSCGTFPGLVLFAKMQNSEWKFLSSITEDKAEVFLKKVYTTFRQLPTYSRMQKRRQRGR